MVEEDDKLKRRWPSMTCPHCSQETPLRKKKQFKCVHCLASVIKPLRDIKCQFCKNKIKTTNHTQKFCSVNCRVKSFQHAKKTPSFHLRRKIVDQLDAMSLDELSNLIGKMK